MNIIGKRKFHYHIFLLSLILIIPLNVNSQNINFEKSLFCDTTLDVKNHQIFIKKNNSKLLLLVHNKKDKLNLIIQINNAVNDTLLGVFGDIPWDFCVNEKMDNYFFLYGNYMVKYDLNAIDNINHVNLSIGNANSVNYMNNKIVVVNYVNDGQVEKPIMAVYNPNSLNLEYKKQLYSYNYNAFAAAISPYQNRQVEVSENKIIFTDFISGMIDVYDIEKDTGYTIKQFAKMDKEIHKIRKLSSAYIKNSTYKIFDNLNLLLDNRKGRILQSICSESNFYIFRLIGTLNKIDSINIYTTDYSLNKSFVFHSNYRELSSMENTMDYRNYALNEIYTDKIIAIKHSIYVLQKVNMCPEYGKKLGDIYLYKPENKRVYVINEYSFK